MPSFLHSLLQGQLSGIQDLADKKAWRKEAFPLVKDDWVQGHSCKPDSNKSMSADEIHPQVLRKIANVIAKPYSMIFESSWSTGNLSGDWSKANVTSVFKQGRGPRKI